MKPEPLTCVWRHAGSELNQNFFLSLLNKHYKKEYSFEFYAKQLNMTTC